MLAKKSENTPEREPTPSGVISFQMESDPGEVTLLLDQWRGGDGQAFDRLFPLVYSDLHRTAGAYLRRERPDHTLQTTDLVHEAYLRLAGAKALDPKNRSHFFTIAARAMRRILVDHARSQQKEKRVGAHRRLPLEEAALVTRGAPAQIVAIHEALEELSGTHPRQVKLVEFRFFGGFSENEAAEILELSRATLTRDWRFAKIWLNRHLDNT